MLKKSDLIISLCTYIVLELCVIALTVICFLICWPVGFLTILLGAFIFILIISTVQQYKGKKPIIRQEKTDIGEYKMPISNKSPGLFWKAIGVLGVLGEEMELKEAPPLKKKSVLNSTYYDDEHLHTEESHETEDGYCMECDVAVEDILE